MKIKIELTPSSLFADAVVVRVLDGGDNELAKFPVYSVGGVSEVKRAFNHAKVTVSGAKEDDLNG